jgi:hypothetical protein
VAATPPADLRPGLFAVGIDVLRALTSVEADHLVVVVDDAQWADG